LLKDRLTQNDIDLLVIYGQPGQKDARKKDAVDFAGGVYKRNVIFSIGYYLSHQLKINIMPCRIPKDKDSVKFCVVTVY
jgi:hypothetical protein